MKDFKFAIDCYFHVKSQVTVCLLEKDLLQKILNETKDYSNDPVLILSGFNWHEGVIGIVAARLKEKFNKPVIIISLTGDIGKASARSVIGFDIG